VADQNIPPGTELDPLIDAGAFRVLEVPNESLLVPPAIRSIDELRGQTTAVLIYRNEQIPMERLEGIPDSNEDRPGGCRASTSGSTICLLIVVLNRAIQARTALERTDG
jgi:hypothetical protein